MIALALRHWKLAAGAGLLAALVAGYLWHRAVLIEAGREEVRAEWKADTAARDKAMADAIADARAREAVALANNARVEREYLEKLNAAAADRESVYSLLQSARGQVRAVTSREATSATIAAATRETAIAERVDRAVAGVVVEARANADQLDALIAVIEPQL